MSQENLQTGYIKIWRSIYENPYHPLNQNRKFTQFEAMQDLILQARGNTQPKTLKGVQVKRGQLAITQRQLAHRWMWNLETVNKFLNGLEKTERFIERKTERSFSIITIVNYELYNPLDEQKTEQDSEHQTERKTEHLVMKGNKFKKKINKRKNLKSEKRQRKETDGEVDRGKDSGFDHLLDSCRKLKMGAALRHDKYLNLREVYCQKLNWASQLKKCLLYNYNKEKKSINANTILNWMETALSIQKKNEEKLRNYNEDKKYSSPVVTKAKAWVPPAETKNPVTKEAIERLKKQVSEKFSFPNP